jgi:hypothetical protein
MTPESFDSKQGPYELGLSETSDAIPHLVDYLRGGGPNERRLAASAIRKLAARHRVECQAAVIPLIACLDDPGPQVRQYALKALSALQLTPEALERIRAVQADDDRAYNRDFAAAILRRYPGVREAVPQASARPDSPPVDPLHLRIEKCLEALGMLEGDLQVNLGQLWEAEDELADARYRLERAEQELILRGVEGKNEAERRAHLTAALPRERERVDRAEHQHRAARREHEEFRTTLNLLQQRLKALELLVSLHANSGA